MRDDILRECDLCAGSVVRKDAHDGERSPKRFERRSVVAKFREALRTAKFGSHLSVMFGLVGTNFVE
jgi:hypothetical protein